MVIKHGHGKSTENGGFDRKNTDKWSILHCQVWLKESMWDGSGRLHVCDNPLVWGYGFPGNSWNHHADWVWTNGYNSSSGYNEQSVLPFYCSIAGLHTYGTSIHIDTHAMYLIETKTNTYNKYTITPQYTALYYLTFRYPQKCILG